MPTLFSRAGLPHIVADGVTAYRERVACSRCGGAGGAQKWDYTGWTCFACGGAGSTGERSLPLYTAEKLAKLNATRDKRRAKVEAERLAKEAARKAEAAATRDALLEACPMLPVWAAHSNEIVADIGRRCIERATAPTEKQAAAVASILERIAAREAALAAALVAPYLGKVGERVEVALRLEKLITLHSAVYGVPTPILHLFTNPETGARASWKSSAGKIAEEGATVRLRATVKETTTYKEIPQTVLTRARLAQREG